MVSSPLHIAVEKCNAKIKRILVEAVLLWHG